MICYFFPPITASAVARSVGLARELKEMGCEPVVLTVKTPRDMWNVRESQSDLPEGINTVRTKELGLIRIIDMLDAVLYKILLLVGIKLKIHFFRDVMCIPDPQIFWLNLKMGFRLAKASDMIYVSCSPFSSAIQGVIIKKIAKKKLIIDFRDPWTLNLHSVPHTFLHKYLIKKMERWVIKNADKMILNTKGATELYRNTYRKYAYKMEWIPNAFDKLNKANEVLLNENIKIVHVGSLYGGRDPAMFLQALSAFQDDFYKIEFIQIGGTFASYELFKDKVNIKIIESLKHEEALEYMRNATALYLRQARDLKKRDVAVAAKTYEYISTGLPIIVDCPPGDNYDVMKEYAENTYFVADENINSYLVSLKKLVSEIRTIKPNIKESFIQTFSRRAAAKKLLDIVSSVNDASNNR